MAEKRYVGVGWLKEFKNGGHVLNISLKLDEVNKLPVDKYGNVYLVIGKRKEPDAKSKATHWVAVDEFKYQPKDEGF